MLDRVEDRRLDDHLASSPSPTSDVGAAHDPGDADRPRRIGDEQRLGIELALDVVERLEPLARRARRTTMIRPSLHAPSASNVWIGLPSSSMT